MKNKLMSYNVRFNKLFLIATFMGGCQMAYGDWMAAFIGVVTNVPDATHVTFVYPIVQTRSGESHRSRTVQLDGIAAPEDGSSEEAALLDILRKTLLGKTVDVVERIDSGESRGADIYVIDDGRSTPKNNVNLMLLREGFARFTGRNSVFDRITYEMIMEAQRLAQAERKGIWADFEPPPDPSPAITNAPADPPQPPPDTPTNVVVTVEPPTPAPVANKTTPWRFLLFIGSFIIIGSVIVWRFLIKKSA